MASARRPQSRGARRPSASPHRVRTSASATHMPKAKSGTRKGGQWYAQPYAPQPIFPCKSSRSGTGARTSSKQSSSGGSQPSRVAPLAARSHDWRSGKRSQEKASVLSVHAGTFG